MKGAVNDDIDKHYGKIGMESQDDIDAKAKTWQLVEYSEEEEKAILQVMEANRGKERKSPFLVIPGPNPHVGELLELDIDSL